MLALHQSVFQHPIHPSQSSKSSFSFRRNAAANAASNCRDHFASAVWVSAATASSCIQRRLQRRAVEAPTVAIPSATVEEETRQKRADQYRLLLFTELLMSFTDTESRPHSDYSRSCFRASENVSELVRKKDLMFIERDFVARCLMTVCGLRESNAYQVFRRLTAPATPPSDQMARIAVANMGANKAQVSFGGAVEHSRLREMTIPSIPS
eukprot:Skav222727  [mRNA]  locus=scaffold2390:177571:182159:+ [translate_table: standard]